MRHRRKQAFVAWVTLIDTMYVWHTTWMLHLSLKGYYGQL